MYTNKKNWEDPTLILPENWEKHLQHGTNIFEQTFISHDVQQMFEPLEETFLDHAFCEETWAAQHVEIVPWRTARLFLRFTGHDWGDISLSCMGFQIQTTDTYMYTYIYIILYIYTIFYKYKKNAKQNTQLKRPALYA